MKNPPVRSDISHEALGFLLLQYRASLLMENPPSPGAQTYLDEPVLHCLILVQLIKILSRHGVPLLCQFFLEKNSFKKNTWYTALPYVQRWQLFMLSVLSVTVCYRI
ncbi:hypothetical protein GQ55_2G064900 [Panicum hallii var. hallii]|uniref:Uncharacterized protein n=1 Tax=Panicum hallii var. hallii TaxID=1504633 RepID=A0A2T7EM40_9POAL|nr:hypothetical protein GQ55_2G064900 [Panicum hallii var. hallii]